MIASGFSDGCHYNIMSIETSASPDVTISDTQMTSIQGDQITYNIRIVNNYTGSVTQQPEQLIDQEKWKDILAQVEATIASRKAEFEGQEVFVDSHDTLTISSTTDYPSLPARISNGTKTLRKPSRPSIRS